VKIERVWTMPSGDTFDVKPIAALVWRYLKLSSVSVDPFARDKRWATHTNDLNPNTNAEHHMDAEDFLVMLKNRGAICDLAIFDPPYSPRQIKECYEAIGIHVGSTETQNSALYSRVRDALMPVLAPNATVLSFGWNSSGMGMQHGFEIQEILLCCHGGAHNDTICTVDQRGTGRVMEKPKVRPDVNNYISDILGREPE